MTTHEIRVNKRRLTSDWSKATEHITEEKGETMFKKVCCANCRRDKIIVRNITDKRHDSHIVMRYICVCS